LCNNYKIVYSQDNVRIVDKGTDRYLYLFGNNKADAFQARVKKYDCNYLSGYETIMMSFVNTTYMADKIIIVGCGSGTILRNIRQSYPDSNITVIDVIDVMPLICENFFGGFPADTFILDTVENIINITELHNCNQC